MLRVALLLCAGMAAAEPCRPGRSSSWCRSRQQATADPLARVVADPLGPVLGQPVVVEHRPGAGGIVGHEQVKRASPDGYTLVVSSLGDFIISPVFTLRSVQRLLALFANKHPPLRTLSDLAAYAKSRPGAVTDATISIGSQTQLLNEQFQAQAGIKMTHVPYRGAGQIVTDVLGGHIATGITALAAVSGQVSSGAVR